METEVFDVPIVARPNLVFFPRTLLTIRLPADRADSVMDGWLERRQQIGVALTRPSAAKANGCACANPAIHRVLGLGAVVDCENLPNGETRLKLEGRTRATVLQEFGAGEDRRAIVEILKDHYAPERREELLESQARLAREARQLGEHLPHFAKIVDRLLDSARHPGILADLAAAHFVVDSYDRQCILAEFDVIRRIDLTAIQLAAINYRLQSRQPNPELSDS